MPEPQTLLQMAGAPNRPHALAESAVVMIDAQMEYVKGRLALTGIGPALDLGYGCTVLGPACATRRTGRAGWCRRWTCTGPNWRLSPTASPSSRPTWRR